MNSSDGIAALDPLWRVLLALAPVQLFLLGLVALDTFRLVRPRRIFLALAAGAAAAVLSFVLNNSLLSLSGLALLPYALLVAPVVEETAKGFYCDWLVRSRRTGFLVDATLLGFAVGAGFATAENIYYLGRLEDRGLSVWAIRGLGTAVMHGGATALFAALRHLGDAFGRTGVRAWSWSWPAAVLFHGVFNRAMTHPVPATVALLVILPPLLVLVHRRGQRNLRRWLGRGFDRDRRLLELIRAGGVLATPLGRHLGSLGETVRPEVRADMLCLLRLEAELSLAAKGLLMMREHGFAAQPPPDVAEKLAELRWLERSIGRAGLLALGAVRPWRGRDSWQRHLLEEESGA